MVQPLALAASMALLCAAYVHASAIPVSDGTRDGETRPAEAEGFLAWDARSNTWVDPVAFWASYAEGRGGLRWGRRASYPPYNEVQERDLLLIELPTGVCLMEFWHRRWRRAQDVRRWSPEFNRFGACPHVFDE